MTLNTKHHYTLQHPHTPIHSIPPTPTTTLSLTPISQAPPGRTCVIGAGYVALECAGFLTALDQVSEG
jgi:pyruvate/2-oxoglutarate dehydrogenase complex dihydrolipoamide dehydrogenase (E3) component